MSYCRWSTDSYQSDIYAYGDVAGGYTVHVARNRYVSETPRPEVPSWESVTPQEYVEASHALTEWTRAARVEPIGLPHDGADFRLDTLEELRDTLLMLRAAGYVFPSDVLATINQEIADGERAEDA